MLPQTFSGAARNLTPDVHMLHKIFSLAVVGTAPVPSVKIGGRHTLEKNDHDVSCGWTALDCSVPARSRILPTITIGGAQEYGRSDFTLNSAEKIAIGGVGPAQALVPC